MAFNVNLWSIKVAYFWPPRIFSVTIAASLLRSKRDLSQYLISQFLTDQSLILLQHSNIVTGI